MAAVRRLEDGERMPVLTGRNSKRRFRGILEWERTRHRRRKPEVSVVKWEWKCEDSL